MKTSIKFLFVITVTGLSVTSCTNSINPDPPDLEEIIVVSPNGGET